MHQISYNYRRCEDQLREIISERLRQESPLTWPDIIGALRTDIVSENRLASEIENKYIHQLPPTASVAPQATSLPLQSLLPLRSLLPLQSSLPIQSLVPASQCDTSLPARGEYSIVFPHYHVHNGHTLHSTQVMSRTTHHLTTMSTHNPTQLAQSLAFMRTNTCRDTQNVLPPLQSSLHSQSCGTQHPQPSASSLHDSTRHTDICIHGSRVVEVINRHSTELTTAIGSDFHYFSNKFIELGFVTRTAAGDISTKLGIGHEEKGHRLLNFVIVNCNASLDKKKWFSKFVAVFSPVATYTDLATSMIEDFSSDKHSARAPPVYHNIPLQPVLRAVDPLESVRQAPCREHFQSEEEPQRRHLQVAVTSSPIQQFIDYVKTIYRESEVERDTKVLKWPPTGSTVYMNLACINRKIVSGKNRKYAEITEAMVRDGNVDAINTTKGPIEFNEIAQGISIPSGKYTDSHAIQMRRVILVEGAPGVGKSTFAREFCRRWERGEIAQEYQLVLLLRLTSDRISKANSLKDLIYHPLEDVAQAVSEELLCFHALIILEGFDRLPDHCRNDQSVFFQLIAGKLLPQATVLVVSRPWATERIRWNYGNRIYQHIEILGFTSQQITEYIERTIPQDKVSDLITYLEKHPQIRSVMYIPLNCAIVVTVYQESQESRCALPTTLTELYTAMAQTLLFRYLRGHHQYETTTMKTFKDLPLAVYTKFSDICELAYKGIVGTSDQVQRIFTGAPSDFDSLGLMDSVTELCVTQGPVSSHNFLHLTFQEYFAAVHISTLSPATQLEHFQRHKEGRLRVVLRFLAGLKKFELFFKGKCAPFPNTPTRCTR